MTRAFVAEGLALPRRNSWRASSISAPPTVTPPDRPRPDIARLTTWMTE